MSDPWGGKRVLLTGGAGFLGKWIHKKLIALGADVQAPRSTDVDLRDRSSTIDLLALIRPQIVVHAAVQGGGIGWMKSHPVESGQDNLRMALNLLESSHLYGVSSFIGISSACAYPKSGAIPYREEHIWDGYPEPTNGPYALSKRVMMDLGRAYFQQHGLHCAFPVLANLYGPGDRLLSSRAHVVADLNIRCAGNPRHLTVWGTGAASREFLYVEDAAAGVLACHKAPPGSIVIIGTGLETPIRELAAGVIAAHGLEIPLQFDESKPDGQIRKVMDVGWAREQLSWTATTSLKKGLHLTASWYRSKLCC